MTKISIKLGVALLVLGACGSLKYDVLKGTSIPNPPTAPIKVYIKEFRVESKASVIDPRAAVAAAGSDYLSSSSNSGLTEGGELVRISRSSRIEDLSGATLRELRQEKVRIFTEIGQVVDLEGVRWVENPFVLVPVGSEEADLEITGTALINSERIAKQFSRMTKNIEITLVIKDLKSGNVNEKETLRTGIHMIFNSKELEEAMAVAVVTGLTQKILF